ncbi:exported hypothetical protein [Rubrivivax sp. A210]|uniref:hypothetical protein n=1 Tax=Rubrivivax sp. A210 TaxID=2772301 RepID=UPI001918705C|nr:hypothetical protein [Rubrivivax sp. A210]CAD5375102.1 exported hypothetical protein [Rubrivivax sp. A210]
MIGIHRHAAARLAQLLVGALALALVAACASTTATLVPSPQAPVCDRGATALVLWAPAWRPDQKDVAQREEAAAAGLGNFLAGSPCFARSEIRRIPDLAPSSVAAEMSAAGPRFDRVVVIGVRELGPVLSLLSSAALVEGGTEVVLQVAEHAPSDATRTREFVVQWRHGGPGVVKGVASLPADMQAALVAGLQPVEAAR